MTEVNYDDAAKVLFDQLGLDKFGGVRAGCVYNPLDPIIKVGDAAIYVGNEQAARSRKLLDAACITHVVNCTENIANFHEAPLQAPGEAPLQYYRFPVSFWPRHVNASHASILAFCNELFDFIDAALAGGGSVLVHCLAGAHRAGTTGVLCLMRFRELRQAEATALARRLRPAINPIGGLPELLRRYELAVAAGGDDDAGGPAATGRSAVSFLSAMGSR